MPTGYTATIKPDTTIEAFVWTCARAFGALVTMRDDPADAPIPQKLEPATYYRDARERAMERLRIVQAWSADDALADMTRSRQDSAEAAARYRAEREEQRKSYVRMLNLVERWQPPTPDHLGLKKFMVEQITESIKFDCGDYSPDEPRTMTALEYKGQELERAERDVARYSEEWAKEQERTNGRNKWIDAIRDSFSREMI